MSLINQMLRDLDARRATHGAGTQLPGDVRPLPPLRPSRWPLLVGVAGVLLLAGGTAAVLFSGLRLDSATANVPVPPPVLSATVPAPVAMAVVPPATVPATPVPAPDPTPISVAPVAPTTPAIEPGPLEALDGSLRLAEFLTLPPDPPAAVVPIETPAVAVKKPATVAGKKEKTARAPAQPEATTQDAGPREPRPAIERSESAAAASERAELDYRRAVGLVSQSQSGEAQDVLRQVLHREPGHTLSRQLLVRLLLEAHRPDEAAQVLQDGVRVQPQQPAWAMSLARLQVDRGALAEAAKTLEQSLGAAGGSADYHGFAGHVLQRLGRQKEAIDHYLVAARLAPGDGRWWLGLGLAYDAEGRLPDARDAFLRARQCGNLSPELLALIDQKLR